MSCKRVTVRKLVTAESTLTIWAATWQNQQCGCAPAKTQISLCIRPVWSVFLGSLATNWAHSEDSDQTGQPPGWSEFAGRTLILLVLSWGGSYQLWSYSYAYMSHVMRKPFLCHMGTTLAQISQYIPAKSKFFRLKLASVAERPVWVFPVSKLPYDVAHTHAWKLFPWNSQLWANKKCNHRCIL